MNRAFWFLSSQSSDTPPPIPPIPTKNLRGSLIIRGTYPFGRNRGQPNNALFVDEIDLLQAPDQDRALDAYQALGYNTIVCGPAVANGYAGHYPNTDYRGNIDGFITYLTKCRNRGLHIILVLLPDTGYYLRFDDGGNAVGWNWQKVIAELDPIYRDPRIQVLVGSYMLAWEPLYVNAEFVRAVQWARNVVGTAQLRIHLPPGHSAPGLSSELTETFTEGKMWVNIAPWIDGHLMQTASFRGTDQGRTQLQQFLYDTWDIGRRYDTGFNGWPRFGYGMRPLDVIPFEYRAYVEYWDDEPASVAVNFGSQALIEVSEFVTSVLDGGPPT